MKTSKDIYENYITKKELIEKLENIPDNSILDFHCCCYNHVVATNPDTGEEFWSLRKNHDTGKYTSFTKINNIWEEYRIR